MSDWLGRTVEVIVEAPRGSFVKRRPDGRVDLRSPLPLPWNYGSVVGEVGGDGDPLDAILTGPRRARGHREVTRVVGVVHFVDAGAVDDKLVCGAIGPAGRLAVAAFFRVYTPLKRLLAWRRGQVGPTGVRTIVWAD